MMRATSKPLLNLLGVVFGVVWIFPVYWMVSNAFQTSESIASRTPSLFPSPATLQHFGEVLEQSNFWSALRMSLVVSLIVVVGALLFAFLAAVAISRFRFRGRAGFITAVIVLQMVPAEALFISQYKMLDQFGLLNSILGLSIMTIGATLPFTTWILKGFVDGVPFELEEAAMIDGCSRWRAFFTVTFPLLAGGLVASSIFAFLAAWNEYTLALVLLTSDASQTLPLWLQSFETSMLGTNWGGVMAGSTLISIPVVILFMLVQKKMTQGLVSGAVKG
ncbi:carbohydrate ABC transporter permease [Micrococcales bacterium 31B]|nr:carbohydrate ABC transporter permease [Micrococcales bacterium 31B]